MLKTLVFISVTSLLAMNNTTSNLEKHVRQLVSVPQPRNYKNIEVLDQVAAYIEAEFKKSCPRVSFQSFDVKGKTYKNVICSFGDSKERIVVGAHYDVDGNQQGADDNASGVAGILELARLLGERGTKNSKQIDIVAYTLEEEPHFGTEKMGSYVHAKSLKDNRVNVKLMMSLEMIGFFRDKENSQSYPVPQMKYIYGTVGDFVAVVGHTGHISLSKSVKELMNEKNLIRVEALNAPKIMEGIDFSDHRSYWEFDFPALMITDTAFFRNKNYHKVTDTVETLDFSKMADVVESVYNVIISF